MNGHPKRFHSRQVASFREGLMTPVRYLYGYDSKFIPALVRQDYRAGILISIILYAI